jgi:hypothetical protein
VELHEIVTGFADAMTSADSRGPIAVSPRSGRRYQAGIGPHPEDRAVDLVVAELAQSRAEWAVRLRVCYPGSQQTCDLLIGEPLEWALEVKMWRRNGDNGKPDDTAFKDILAPYSSDRSAVSDCLKLASSTLKSRLGILIYGFDDKRRPLKTMIEAFEVLASHYVQLGPRQEAPLGALVHPVHASGAVFGWQVFQSSSNPGA